MPTKTLLHYFCWLLGSLLKVRPMKILKTLNPKIIFHFFNEVISYQSHHISSVFPLHILRNISYNNINFMTDCVLDNDPSAKS